MKKLLPICYLALLTNTALLSDTNNTAQDATGEIEQLEQQTSNKKDDYAIEQLAVSTLANMAQSILNIAQDPNDQQAVTNNVVNIVAHFTNLVAHAMKNRQLRRLLTNQLYRKKLEHLVITQILPVLMQSEENTQYSLLEGNIEQY